MQTQHQQFDFNKLSAGNVKDAMKAAGAGSGDLWKVPVADIHVMPGFNVRLDNEETNTHIEGLAASILANGFYTDKPLAGYVASESGKDVIYISDGHCRLAAAKLAIERGAEIKLLPVVVSPRGTSQEDLLVRLVTTNSGRPLTPMETAEVCKRLIGYGLTEAEIAKRLSFTPKYVADLLALIAAPVAVRQAVSDGQVSATTAIKAVKEHGGEAGAVIGDAVATAKAAGKTRATSKHFKKDETVGDKPRGATTAKRPHFDAEGAFAVVKELVDWADDPMTRSIDATLAEILDSAREVVKGE